MPFFVQKFGGTSVGSVELIEKVADRLKESYDRGDQLVVVVSAMSGVTNTLVDLASQISEHPSRREMDVLLSTGEQTTMALLAIALHKRHCLAKSYTGWQVALRTDNQHGKARIESIDSASIMADLQERCIVIVAGFQGVSTKGEITTFGRGGSDTSAVALAAALKADECQIYTDVDGVYTADPRIVPRAKKMEQVTFEEMLELSSLGAKVLQIRSVEIAGKFKVPLRVLSAHQKEATSGTLISFEKEKDMEQPIVSGIAHNLNEAKLSILGVPDIPGFAAAILSPIAEANIEVDMIIQNISEDKTTNFTFTVARADAYAARDILEKVCQKIEAREVICDTSIAKVSVVGIGMKSHSGVANTTFKALAEANVNIQMISTSEIKISVVVDENYAELAVRTLHTAFQLDSESRVETASPT